MEGLRCAPTDLYPYSGRRFDRGGGVEMHYLDEGAGPPVVMVHGNPTWSFYWRSLVEGLKGSHRCLVPDHVGCGLSDRPGDRDYAYTLKTRIDDLEALLDHAGVAGPVTLAVHDWGGMIGLGWAARHPHRVARLVVTNTAAFPLMEGKRFPPSLAMIRNTPLGPFLVRGLNAFSRAAVKRCAVRRPLPPEVRAAYLAPHDSWDRRLSVLRFVEDIPLGPGDGAWESVVTVGRSLAGFRDLPMLIAWGLRDFIFDGDFLAEWERRFPDAEVLRVEDAGHFLLEDAPEVVVPRVAAFLGCGA